MLLYAALWLPVLGSLSDAFYGSRDHCVPEHGPRVIQSFS